MTQYLIIVNLLDLIWHDVDVPADDLNPFFFKNNPVNYLDKLGTEGWTIYMYSSSTGDEIKRVKLFQKDPETYIINKLSIVRKLLGNVGILVNEHNIAEIITHANPSSFAIIDTTRDFPTGIARYSPIEIFELSDPPTIPLRALILIFQVSNITRMEQIRSYLLPHTGTKVPILPIDRNQRDIILNTLRTKYPDMPLFIIWSPVYRYSKDDNIIELTFFNRPDQDNIPKVIKYTWGY